MLYIFNSRRIEFQSKILNQLIQEKEKFPQLIDKLAENYSSIVRNKKICPKCDFQYSTKKQKCGKPCNTCIKCLGENSDEQKRKKCKNPCDGKLPDVEEMKKSIDEKISQLQAEFHGV